MYVYDQLHHFSVASAEFREEQVLHPHTESCHVLPELAMLTDFLMMLIDFLVMHWSLCITTEEHKQFLILWV